MNHESVCSWLLRIVVIHAQNLLGSAPPYWQPALLTPEPFSNQARRQHLLTQGADMPNPTMLAHLEHAAYSVAAKRPTISAIRPYCKSIIL